MTRPLPAEVKTITVIGGGTIGASWTAYFLSRGLEVVVVDPYVTEPGLRTAIERMWPDLTEVGLAPEADKDRWTVRRQFDQTLAATDFVQENSPERLDVKRALLAELEQVIGPDVVISSSTSSLLASDIQAECRHPERVLVGHPFNPPHLVPLVEVVAGRRTAPEAVDWTVELYRRLGKYPVRVKKEVIGHIANRLTAALYREVVHLVAEGIASVEDIDAAITQGPGLRWALMGPNLVYHLAGGEGGIRQYLEHLGPTQESRWQELGDPKLTDVVQQQIVDGVLEMVADRSMTDLARQRDAGLIQLLKLIEQWQIRNE